MQSVCQLEAGFQFYLPADQRQTWSFPFFFFFFLSLYLFPFYSHFLDLSRWMLLFRLFSYLVNANGRLMSLADVQKEKFKIKTANKLNQFN